MFKNENGFSLVELAIAAGLAVALAATAVTILSGTTASLSSKANGAAGTSSTYNSDVLANASGAAGSNNGGNTVAAAKHFVASDGTTLTAYSKWTNSTSDLMFGRLGSGAMSNVWTSSTPVLVTAPGWGAYIYTSVDSAKQYMLNLKWSDGAGSPVFFSDPFNGAYVSLGDPSIEFVQFTSDPSVGDGASTVTIGDPNVGSGLYMGVDNFDGEQWFRGSWNSPGFTSGGWYFNPPAAQTAFTVEVSPAGEGNWVMLDTSGDYWSFETFGDNFQFERSDLPFSNTVESFDFRIVATKDGQSTTLTANNVFSGAY